MPCSRLWACICPLPHPLQLLQEEQDSREGEGPGQQEQVGGSHTIPGPGLSEYTTEENAS